MSFTGIGEVSSLIGNVIDKIWPNKDEAEKAKLRLFELQQSGMLAEMAAIGESDKGQVEINKVEAASDSPFKSGWRPAAGWTCVLGLFYSFIAFPALSWLSVNIEWKPPPSLDIEALLALLFGLLGLGYYRTREKLGK